MSDIVLHRTEFPRTSDLIRYIHWGEDILFAAPDVCRALEYKNVGSLLSQMDDSQKLILTAADIAGTRQPRGWMPHAGRINLITEDGLARVIKQSNRPNAVPFLEWLTNEVFPAVPHKEPAHPQLDDQKQPTPEQSAPTVVSEVLSSMKVHLRVYADGTVHCNHGRMEAIVAQKRMDERGEPLAYFRCTKITGAGYRQGIRTECGTWHPVKAAKKNRPIEDAPKPEAAKPASPAPDTAGMYLETPAGRIYGTPDELATLLKAMS
ncbi:BRO-N domain-containing protein [Nocardia nova]|uniref:BRO-N domain-containing protein n=1 Tax=Nocardia nova TaxID=37330 RepID=UPI0033D3929D